jgi:F-type H+-transporting ATPase subunit a
MTPPTFLLAAREGFKAPTIEDFAWPPIVHLELFGVDLSINRTVLLTFLVAALQFTLFFVAFRRPTLVPRGLQNVLEAGVDFVRKQIVLEVIGAEGLRFVPYLVTLFFFIFLANVLEIIPLINFPITSRFAIPLFLAIITWAMFIWTGIKTQGLGHYFRNVLFPPGLPVAIYVLVTPIELVSVFLVRPFTLSVRLLANMIAGHLILTVFFLGTAYLLGTLATSAFGVAAFVMSTALVGFEFVVAGLQAYIFTMLTAVYLAGSLEPEH